MTFKMMSVLLCGQFIKQQGFRCGIKRMQKKKFSCGSCFFNKMIDDKTESQSKALKKEDSEKTLQQRPEGEETDEEIIARLKEGDILHPYKSPFERTYKIVKEDIMCTGRSFVYNFTGVKLGNLEIEYFPRYTDILVIGAGPIGLSIAYALRSCLEFGPSIIVVDKNDTFPPPSTNLGQGMLTHQLFTDNEEILMSEYCAKFLSEFHRNTEVMNRPLFHVPYEPLGSLVLADSTNAEEVIHKAELLNTMQDGHFKMLDYSMLKEKFPQFEFKDILFGSLGMCNEGLFDPWTFLMGLKCKSYNLGVKYVKAEVIDISTKKSSLSGVIVKLPDGSYNSIDFAYCVLATGLDTLKIVDKINSSDVGNIKLRLPLVRRKRYEYLFYNPDGPGLNCPIIINPDGTYFRREGLIGHYVAGVPSVSCDEENSGLHDVFEEKVKPFLVKRIPNFEKYELVNGWVDEYDTNTGNEIGIIGPHPQEPRLVFATGFSHLGWQYLPAVGRGVMEYIYYDNYRTIDFTPYHVENIYQKQHLAAEKKRKELLESRQRTAISE